MTKLSEERKRLRLKCGYEGEILEDGSILIDDLCPSDALQIIEMEEREEKQVGDES